MPPVLIPRRTIEELRSLYSLEPSVRDVFVEGPSDQRFFRWFVDSEVSDGPGVGIHCIDEIDVPAELAVKHGRTPGHRSEVLVLCSELEATFGDGFTRATGIVDQDVSAIIPDVDVSALVLKTDYACLEAYGCTNECLKKLISIAFGRVKKTPAEILAAIGPTLRFLFAVRAANERLGTRLVWIDFLSYVKFDGHEITFREADFLRAYLQIGRLTKKFDAFQKEVAAILATLSPDPRMSMNGHDAITLLGFYLRGFHKKAEDADRTKVHVLGHLVCCCTSSAELRVQAMFSALVSRVSKRTAI